MLSNKGGKISVCVVARRADADPCTADVAEGGIESDEEEYVRERLILSSHTVFCYWQDDPDEENIPMGCCSC